MIPRVLFILHLPPPVHGAAMVGKYIHDSKLVNEKFDCRWINMATAKDLSDIGHGGLRKLWLTIKKWWIIAKTIKEWKPNLVYITPNSWGHAFYRDSITVWIAKHLCSRVVLHFHNKGVSQRQDKKIDDWLYRHFFYGVHVILLTPALYDDVSKYVSESQVSYCANGIPDDCEGLRHQSHDIPHILMIANLLKTKGVREMLDACKILNEKGVGFHCTIVGGETSDYSAEMFKEEIDNRGLAGIVEYVGRKYGEEKEAILNNADIFCLPSYTEAFPMVTLEAMSHGLPVVATAVGGIVDQIEEGVNGLLIPCHYRYGTADSGQSPIDVTKLADALRALIDHPAERLRMGEAARRKFLASYTLDAFEHRFTEILSSLCGEPNG